MTRSTPTFQHPSLALPGTRNAKPLGRSLALPRAQPESTQRLDDHPGALDVDDLDEGIGLHVEAVGRDVDQHAPESRLARGPEGRGGTAGLADEEGQRLVAFD